MNFKHEPVLLEETIAGLEIQPNGIYVDGTIGGAGHSVRIAERLTEGKLIGLDQDQYAIERSTQRLQPYLDKVILVKTNFSAIKSVLDNLRITGIDGALLDLGVSSFQLDMEERGFSFHSDAPLDMRMDKEKEMTAATIVNTYSVEELVKIFYQYGEEKWSQRIAEFIVEERKTFPIETTMQLVTIIKKAVPRKFREENHPARKIFQALRIEVNDELGILESGIKDFVEALKPKGRLAVITFHSLEDRIVKNTFKELNTRCLCPPNFPTCICGHTKTIELVNKKPIISSEKEVLRNVRARSAKLRIAQKI